MKNKRSAFSMAEMLVVMLVLAIVIVSMTPITVKRIRRDTVNPDHGSFECFYNTNGKLIERWRNAQGEIIPGSDKEYDPATRNYCEFIPKRGAMFFTINAVGGGSPGTGISSEFGNLPKGIDNVAGADYTNTFYKFRSVLIDTINKSISAFDFTGTTYDEDGVTDTPVKWLKNEGVKIVAVLKSDGGILDDNTGSAFLKATRHDTSSSCVVNPQASQLTWTDGHFVSKKTYSCGFFKSCPCLTAEFYPGVNPANGSALNLMATIQQGGPLYSSDAASPRFAAGADGCKIGVGDNGCFAYAPYGCSPQPGKIADYSTSLRCNSHYQGVGYGYPNQHKTHVTYSDVSTIEFDYTHGCGWDDNPPAISCDPGNSVKWVRKDNDAYTGEKWFLYTMGNLVLVNQKNSKGLNFYAQAGNPGDFQTMYVSRFTKGVKVIPGAPVLASVSTKPPAGNPTVLCYMGKNKSCATADGGEQLLTVAGGKKVMDSKDAKDNTNKGPFIVGNLFELSKSPKVIAYDTINGEQKNEPGTDDTSGNQGEYGNYFLPKNSGFLYPIPDINNAIPDDIGQGGHGAYTVYRKTGLSNAYEMFKANITSAGYGTPRRSSGSNPQNVVAPYECRGRAFTTSGSGADAHYCYAGDGKGGAVVITW